VGSHLASPLDNPSAGQLSDQPLLVSPLDNPSGHPTGQLSGQPALCQGRQTGNLIGY